MLDERSRYELALAEVVAQQGRRDEARQAAGAVLQAAEKSGKPDLQVEAHRMLSKIALMGEDLLRAEEHLLLAKALTPDDQPLIEANLNHDLGRVLFHRSHYDEALRQVSQAYRIFEGHVLREKVAQAVHLWAMCLSRLHRYAEAMRKYKEAGDHFRSIRNPQGSAAVKVNAAALSLRSGQLEEAAALNREAYTQFFALRDERGMAIASLNEGTALMWLGRVPGAETRYREALNRSTANNFELLRSSALVNLGTVRLEQGAIEEARGLLSEGLNLRLKLGHAEAVSDATCLAIACARDGDLAEADRHSGWAAEQLKAPDTPEVEFNQRVHLVRAQVLRLQGRHKEAQSALQDASKALRKACETFPDEEHRQRYRDGFPFNRTLAGIVEHGQWPDLPSIL